MSDETENLYAKIAKAEIKNLLLKVQKGGVLTPTERDMLRDHYSPPQVLRQIDLAEHWGVSQAYISKLRRSFAAGGKGMPDFETLEDADKWRSMNAPPSRRRGGSPSKAMAAQAAGGGSGSQSHRPPPEPPPPIDISGFVNSEEEFDVLMIRHAEEVPQIAFGLYQMAAKSGDAGSIPQRVRDWGEAAKQAAAVRGRFLDIKQRTGELLPLDTCMNIVGITLGGIRTGLSKLGARAAREANPDDPARAQAAIDKAVDRIFSMVLPGEDRIRHELLASTDEPDQSD